MRRYPRVRERVHVVTPANAPRVKAATVKRLQRAAAPIAAEAVTRMETSLPWFAVMSPNQRSWIGLVAQAAAPTLVEGSAHPQPDTAATGGGFPTPPPGMARPASLH